MKKIEKKAPVIKELFSEILIGSVFFDINLMGICSSENQFIITTQLEDFEQPTYEAHNGWPTMSLNGNMEYKTTTLGYYKYVSYYDLKEYGLKRCIENKKYYILDLEYIRKVKAIREAKTLKELQIVLENNLK